MFRPVAFALLSFVALLVHAEELPRVTLSVDGHAIHAEIAATPNARERGLMGRTELAENASMLFVFSRAGVYSLWMANTLIPLDAAFLDGDGTILAIVTMSPERLAIHSSPENTSFALETNAGWFARHGVSAGMRVQGLEQLQRKKRAGSTPSSLHPFRASRAIDTLHREALALHIPLPAFGRLRE